MPTRPDEQSAFYSLTGIPIKGRLFRLLPSPCEAIVLIISSCNCPLVSPHADEGGGQVIVRYINEPGSDTRHLTLPSARLSTSARLRPTNTSTMAFAGKWEVECQEGYEEFCKLLGETETKAATLLCFLFWFFL